jgi:hypothetical protein
MKILIRKIDGICKSRFTPLSLPPPPSISPRRPEFPGAAFFAQFFSAKGAGFDPTPPTNSRNSQFRPPRNTSAVGAAQFSPARERRVKSGAQRRTLTPRESRRLPDAVRAFPRFARVRRVAASHRAPGVVTSRPEERK